MTQGRFKLTGDEMIRFRVIKDIIDGYISQKDAAKKLNRSVRQVRRLQRRVEKEESTGVVHRLLGRPSNNMLSKEIKKQIISLWKEKYMDCELNFTHYTEKLNEIENIKISKDSVRKILREENLVTKKVRKRRKAHKERDPKERVGELLQQDTSPHDWLSIGETQHLVAIEDDATSKILYAQLFKTDGTIPNMKAMEYVFKRFGLPRAVYTDGASWFHYSDQGRKLQPSHQSLREGRNGTKGGTQIGRALEVLGVELIRAYSPQAKGRVERLNRTLQDRLISELRLHKIQDMIQANKFINEFYIPDHNERFAREATCSDSAFIKLANPNESLKNTLCLKFKSCVRNDNIISKAKYYKLQLLPSEHRLSWAKARVEVFLHLDRSVTVRHAISKDLIPFEIKELNFAKEFKHGRSMVSA